MSGPDARAGLRDRVRSLASPVLSIDRRRLDAAFTGLLLAFMLTLLVQTLGYGPQTRLMPLVIGLPVVGLLVFLLATQVSSRLAAFARRYAAGDLFGDLTEGLDEFDLGAPASGDEAEDLIGRLELLSVLVWVMVLFVLVVVVGFLAGTFAYLVAFYRLRAGQDWLRTVLYAAVVWVFAVVVFKAVLNTPLYEGLLGVDVPLPV